MFIIWCNVLDDILLDMIFLLKYLKISFLVLSSCIRTVGNLENSGKQKMQVATWKLTTQRHPWI